MFSFLISRSTPVECLHTILLGPVKYLLQELMSRLTPREKDIIVAKMNSFNYSGMDNSINGNSICRYGCLYACAIVIACFMALRYYKSLVGRDFKQWSQVGIFIVWEFLTTSEKKMWLSLAKVYT